MLARSLSLLCILALAFQLEGQTAFDALRYSQFQVGGTARTVGAGGALGALGSDFATLSVNPAGLGWYRRSEFTFTPAFMITNTTSVLTNEENNAGVEEDRSVFNINNFGLVITSRPRSRKWKTFNFGFGLNRLANFNQRFVYSGFSTGSITDRFLELANSPEGPDAFEAGVAIDANALFTPVDIDDVYLSDYEVAPNAEIFRTQDVETRGAINEFLLSFAGNYDEKILFGATIGFPIVNFNEDKLYEESDPDDVVPLFDDLQFREELTTTGWGINAKAGVIIRPVQMLRLGAAVHTPTAYRLSDRFNTSMVYNFTDDMGPFRGEAASPDGLFDYRLRTPWRFVGSLGLVFNKSGFLSAEVEHLNYNKSQFRYDGFAVDENAVNGDIRTQFQSVTNFRFGGEFAYEVFRLRAGFNILPSPFEGDNTVNHGYSAGVGYRGNKFFFDLAYRRNNLTETYVPYQISQDQLNPPPEQFVENEVVFNRILATFGFNF